MDNKKYEEIFKEIRKTLEIFEVPKDKALIIIKLKEVFQIESCDINIEKVQDNEVYEVIIENIQVYLTINRLTDRFVISPKYDILNELDEIIN